MRVPVPRAERAFAPIPRARRAFGPWGSRGASDRIRVSRFDPYDDARVFLDDAKGTWVVEITCEKVRAAMTGIKTRKRAMQAADAFLRSLGYTLVEWSSDAKG